MDLLTNYKQLTERIAELQREATEHAKIAIAQMAEEYFAKHSSLVSAISWVQYTPYFNDGEECTFSVGDIYVFMKQELDEDGEEQFEEYDEEHAYNSYDYSIERLQERLDLRKAYDVDPIAWSRAKVAEQLIGSYSHYRLREDYYVHNLPEQDTQEQLLYKLEVAELLSLTTFDADTEALTTTLSSIDEEIMRTLFGNHVRVIIKQLADGSVSTTIEEYTHD
jgi:hypothetical protein